MNKIDNYLQSITEYYNPKNRPYFLEGDPFNHVNFPLPASILEHGLRLVITGSWGTGKTTFLDWTVSYAATNSWIPIFISLRNYTSNLSDLMQVSISKFDNLLNLHDLEGNERRVFLFDGFEEVPSLFRIQVISEINELARLNPSNPFIITSRPDESLIFNDWKQISIDVLTQDQIREYLLQTEQGKELWRIIRQSDELIKLASRPLTLATMLNATSRDEYFREYLMAEIPIYAAWRGHTKSPLRGEVTPKDIDVILSTFALETKLQGIKMFSSEYLQNFVDNLGYSNEVRSSISGVFVAAGLLSKSSYSDELTFAHKTLHVSYAAKGLLNSFRDLGEISKQLQLIVLLEDGLAIISYMLRLLTKKELSLFLVGLSKDLLSAIMPLATKLLSDEPEFNDQLINKYQEIVKATAVANIYQQNQDKLRPDILVIAIHGFNTRGDWKNKLGLLLTEQTDGVRFLVRNWDYGRFVLGILNPFARKSQVEKFHDLYNDLLKGFTNPRPALCVVAHSFGTYIIAHAMRRFPEIKIDRVIFMGSALPRAFKWHKGKNRIGKLLNITSNSDFALSVAGLIPGLGGAGKKGFDEKHDWLIHHNEDGSEHSDLFGNEYMLKVWIPFLMYGDEPKNN